MTKQYVSEPLLALLRQTGVSPRDVDAAIERQANRWAHTLLRQGHACVRRIRAATGLEVVGIARKYRRLLVEIEQHGTDGAIAWHYKEVGRTGGTFRCKAAVPDTVLAALPGRALGDLIQPFPALSTTRIDAVDVVHDGWIELTVTPGWQAF